MKAAVMLYKDKYDALPGDHVNAQSYWPDPICKDYAGSSTCNGNGDGKVTQTTSAPEQSRVFQHLTLAGMLSGSSDGTGSYSDIFMNSKIKEGWYTYSSAASGIPSPHIKLFTYTPVDGYSVGVLDPSDAKYIDLKIDDGFAGSGKVISRNTLLGSAPRTCLSAGKYDLDITDTSCVIYFLTE